MINAWKKLNFKLLAGNDFTKDLQLSGYYSVVRVLFKRILPWESLWSSTCSSSSKLKKNCVQSFFLPDFSGCRFGFWLRPAKKNRALNSPAQRNIYVACKKRDSRRILDPVWASFFASSTSQERVLERYIIFCIMQQKVENVLMTNSWAGVSEVAFVPCLKDWWHR